MDDKNCLAHNDSQHFHTHSDFRNILSTLIEVISSCPRKNHSSQVQEKSIYKSEMIRVIVYNESFIKQWNVGEFNIVLLVVALVSNTNSSMKM